MNDYNESVRDKHKNRFKAVVSINYDFGKCKFKASIRQHGDWKDHIFYVPNQRFIKQSLDIKLQEGNIAGIVRFKLLIPKTRSKNEGKDTVIGTHILRKLGLLAPKTFIIDSNVNGQHSKMIFQEKISKEFLENQSKREGPILEGDEQFIWRYGVTTDHKKFDLYENISLSRLVNADWAIKNRNNLNVSLDTLSKLQRIYLEYIGRRQKDTDVDLHNKYALTLDIDLLSNNSIKIKQKWKEFEIIMLALDADHGLRPHNRKFYWNVFQNAFEPIYYDGNISIKSICDSNGRYIKNRIREGDLIYYSRNLDEKNFANIKEKINNLKKETSSNEFKELNIEISQNELLEIFELLNNNIDCIKQALLRINILSEEVNIIDISNLHKEFMTRVNNLDLKFLYIHSEKNIKNNSWKGDDYKICINNILCEKFNNKLEIDWHQILRNQYKIDENYVLYIGSYKNLLNESLFKKLSIPKISILFSTGMRVNYSQINKTLYLNQTQPTDWALIFDSDLSDVTVKFIGKNYDKTKHNNLDKIYNRGLTGCITFQNVKFNNSKILAENGFCEDSVNIVNSLGNIDLISVSRSFSDAIDFDFSNIKIDKIIVNNANNDCVDFSFGLYSINGMKLSRCGDKGISVGENSKFYSKKYIFLILIMEFLQKIHQQLKLKN